jgi:hypothetical protein
MKNLWYEAINQKNDMKSHCMRTIIIVCVTCVCNQDEHYYRVRGGATAYQAELDDKFEVEIHSGQAKTPASIEIFAKFGTIACSPTSIDS